jgi:hypothetical protein
VRLVLDHYPVRSIRDIEPAGGGLVGPGPWRLGLVEVEGQHLSLDDILDGILRPVWGDPRVCYALCMAALGSPDLQPQPFTAADLDRQLDEAAMAFVNHPRGVAIDGTGLRVSSLYRWFEADLGGSDTGIIRHLMAYAAPDLAMRLEPRMRIDGDSFDWRLNDATEAG